MRLLNVFINVTVCSENNNIEEVLSLIYLLLYFYEASLYCNSRRVAHYHVGREERGSAVVVAVVGRGGGGGCRVSVAGINVMACLT